MALKFDKITRARANLVLAHTFFGALALRLKLVVDDNCPTAYTDGRIIGYNTRFIDDLSIEQLTGLLAHEVMHCALLHQTRRGSRKPGKWNAACDYAINPLLIECGMQLPPNGLNNPAYAGKSAEEIYSLIPEDEDWDQSPSNWGAVIDSPGADGKAPSASEQAEQEADWKITLAQAAHVAKQAGKLPASLQRLIDQTMESKLPWRQLLQAFFNDPKPADVSWKQPNRRFVHQGLYLPAREMTNSGDIVVAIDTSGSIGEAELNAFGSEIMGIVDQMKPNKTTVIYCDADIAHVDEFLPGDELEFAAHGGGGTDFRPPFDWLEEHGITPKAFVYLTDGYGPFPEEQEYPVLWVINNEQVTPPWGQHIILQD